MKKVFSIAFTFVLLVSCSKREEIKPEIIIPAESVQVFSSGISFDASANSAIVKFKATDEWSTDATDTKASSWLSVHPPRGSAGDNSITVSAPANPSTEERATIVSIVCGNVRKQFTVKQSGKPEEVIAVESVTLNESELILIKGGTATLSATVMPEDASDKTVAWSSSDTAIATVDESGKVTGVSGGKAIITAKSGEKTATCEVTVTVPVESVALDQASITIDVEQTVTLSATVTPEDASDKTVAWSSSDTAIATVDESGKVTGVKEGKATITAKSGEKTASCEVTVQKKVIAVESITLNASEINLVKGSTATLSATVLPENATDKTVAWSSSDTAVATVDESGKVTGVNEGKATITAKAGEITAKCIVTVQKEKVPAESISLNMTTAQIIVDERLQLTIKLKPAEASYEGVKWESSLPFVATVSDSGVVKGISAGKTTIKVSIGSLSASCEVTVIQFDPGESEGIGDGGSMDSANVNNQ